MPRGYTSTDIIQKRQALGLTQEDFAHLVGVTKNTVARWEAGHVAPSRMGKLLLEPLFRTVAGSGCASH